MNTLKVILFFITLFTISACLNDSKKSGQNLFKYSKVLYSENSTDYLWFDETKIYQKFSFSKKAPKSIAVLTHTSLPFIKMLNGLNCIKGISDLNFIADTTIIRLSNEDKIKNIGNSKLVNFEEIIRINPDLIILNSFIDKTQLRKLQTLRIPLLFFDDHLENHPLGRMEWIKLLGSILDQSALALDIFRTVEMRYNRIKLSIPKSQTKPIIFAGQEYNGVWYVPGGGSYFAQMISDAGATYCIEDKSTGTLKYSNEEIWLLTGKADYWRIVLYDLGKISRKSILESNREYGYLDEVFNKIIYCNTANAPLYEKGIVEPDVILKDLAILLKSIPNKNDSTMYYHILEVPLK